MDQDQGAVDQAGVDQSGVDLSELGDVEHAELKDFEANMGMEGDMGFLDGAHEQHGEQHGEPQHHAQGEEERDPGQEQEQAEEEPEQQQHPAPRMLNPVELIALTRMAFPKCEPAVDEDGRFVIRGLERREGVEKGREAKAADMFPFALASGELRGCSLRHLVSHSCFPCSSLFTPSHVLSISTSCWEIPSQLTKRDSS